MKGGKNLNFLLQKRNQINNKPVNKPFFIVHSPFSLIYTKEHVVKQRTLPTITVSTHYETNEPFGISCGAKTTCNTPSFSADKIIPWLICPLILRGFKFATITTFLPINSSGFGYH